MERNDKVLRLTPCVGMCRLNPKGYCVGCKRSLEQIRDWSRYDDKEKERVIRELAQKETKQTQDE